ncbi:hypothetical protein HDV01_005024 [Terramyces sp. JEL0728]|nr:hypothetical protein HDV01_005024 [Terramyces sp. JEL0728]
MIGFALYQLYHFSLFAIDVRKELISNILLDYEAQRLYKLSDVIYSKSHDYQMFEYRKEDYIYEIYALASVAQFLLSKSSMSTFYLDKNPQIKDILSLLMIEDVKIRIQHLSHAMAIDCETESISHLDKLCDTIATKYPEQKNIRELGRGSNWIVFDFEVVLLNITTTKEVIERTEIPKCESPTPESNLQRVNSDRTLCQQMSSFSLSTSRPDLHGNEEFEGVLSGTTCTPSSAHTPVKKRVRFSEKLEDYSPCSDEDCLPSSDKQDEVTSEGTLEHLPFTRPAMSRQSSGSSEGTLVDNSSGERVISPRSRQGAQVWYMVKKFTAIDPGLKSGDDYEYRGLPDDSGQNQIQITPNATEHNIPHVNTTALQDNPLNEMPFLLSLPFRAADATFDLATDVAAGSIKLIVIKPISIATSPLRWITKFCKF